MKSSPCPQVATRSLLRVVLSVALTAGVVAACATPSPVTPPQVVMVDAKFMPDATPPAAEAASANSNGAPFDLTDPVRIAAGKKRFNINCGAYCHGFEGSGGKTPPFKGNKDFTVPMAFKTITEGRRTSDVMPPWGKAFTPEEIWELVAYLQYLSTQPAPP